MFAAVYLGGPRWNIAYDQDLTHVSAPAKRQAMRRVKSFIEREEPSFGRLLQRLEQEERVLLSTELVRRDESEKDRASLAGDLIGDGADGEGYGDDGYDDPYGEDGYGDEGYGDPYVGDGYGELGSTGGETDPGLGDPSEAGESTEESTLLIVKN